MYDDKLEGFPHILTDKTLFDPPKTKKLSYLHRELELTLGDRYILRGNREGLDFLGYITRSHYTLVQKRVVSGKI